MTRVQLIGILATLCLFMALYFVFSYAKVEATMLEVQKIFYFHVSSAFTVFIAFGVTCLFSILYLIKRKDRYDMIAVASAELGIVFCTIVLLTGPIWARYAWNTWWNWEARLTSTLILWLMYIAYFILRSALAEETKRVYSAVLGIIAYLNVPIVYFSVEIWQGNLHPSTDTKMNLHPTMVKAWMISWLALSVLYVFLLVLRYQTERLKSQLETIQYQQMEKT
ncbi:MAG: cytochrome c biogenesis protein [Candidatus Poribacteria bacterium]|nr:cytochrome c biogenesis protein [Candidatus Poribacteria bacterium]